MLKSTGGKVRDSEKNLGHMIYYYFTLFNSQETNIKRTDNEINKIRY